MRWRSPSKPRCRFAKLVSDRDRVRWSLTGQQRTSLIRRRSCARDENPIDSATVGNNVRFYSIMHLVQIFVLSRAGRVRAIAVRRAMTRMRTGEEA